MPSRILEAKDVSSTTPSQDRTQLQCTCITLWRCSSVVERRSLTGRLSLACTWWITIYMDKLSAVGQLTRSTQPFILTKSINEYSMLKSDGCDHYTGGAIWWMLYEVKTGVLSLQRNNCVIHAWALQRRASHNGVLYKSSFLYLYYGTETITVTLQWWPGKWPEILQHHINKTMSHLTIRQFAIKLCLFHHHWH